MSALVITVTTEPAQFIGPICAYCGEPTQTMVRIRRDDGLTIGAAYCCDQPTHWAWLLSSCEREAEDPQP